MECSFTSDGVFQSLKVQCPVSCQDSGYKGSLHTLTMETSEAKCVTPPSFCFEALLETPKENRLQNSAFSWSFNTPKKERLKDSVRCPDKDVKKEKPSFSSWCETPKISKKDASLRRRLLISKAATDSKTAHGKTADGRSFESSGVLTLKEDFSNGNFDSPDSRLFEALATSTLKAEELALSCRKRRLLFSQVKTSTLEDGSHNIVQPPVPERQTTELFAAQSVLNESILSTVPSLLAPELLETPCCSKHFMSAKENFQTPVNLGQNLADCLTVLSTPSFTPISKLDTSASEDSGFSSLGLDKSQDSSVDHDGSFQELLLQSTSKGKEVQRLTESKRRSRMERQRRLSTLREGGSQSDEDLRALESVPRCVKSRLKGLKALVTEEDDELFLAKTPLGATTLKLEDLSLTPALQMVHAICQQSARLSTQSSLEELLLRSSESAQPFRTTMPLAGLIGRKMGLEKLNILTELKIRNLRHILAAIFNLLSSEDIYRFGQVCKDWDEIVLQDKMTHRRRRSYLKELKMAHELGSAANVPDAETRLNLLNRSALRSVQAQSKTLSTHTPVSGNGTFIQVKQNLRSASKHDKFLQVAKTLFRDESLRPCPRCQHPARCHSVKREGVCSQVDCAFQFCLGCLCAFHGSKECSSAKRCSRKEVLPGSAQSKRNLRRL